VSRSPWRIAYLVSHPIQYQSPLLAYLSQAPELDLTVFYLSIPKDGFVDHGFQRRIEWDVPMLDGFRWLDLGGPTKTVGSCVRPLCLSLETHLIRGRYDAVWIHGYAHQALLRAVVAAKALGTKVLFRAETHLGVRKSSPWRESAKARVLPLFFRSVDMFLAIGTLNAQYYEAFGVPKAKIAWAPYAVDNDHFESDIRTASSRLDDLRQELDIQPGRPIILYCGKLQELKRVDDLMRAYALVSDDRGIEALPYLVIVGDGPQRQDLVRLAQTNGWAGIRFAGFRNQRELPAFYALCDVLVLPSDTERWGVVLNEVMNAAKPIIVSSRVGAAPDLIKQGENGFIYPVGDISALSASIRAVLSNREDRQRMGEASRRIVREFNFEAVRRGLMDARTRLSQAMPSASQRSASADETRI
jgi:glycosyltransferase involved in cell wall biosynthesis